MSKECAPGALFAFIFTSFQQRLLPPLPGLGFFPLVHVIQILGTVAHLAGLGTHAGKGLGGGGTVLGKGHPAAGIYTGAAKLTVAGYRLPCPRCRGDRS